MNFFTFVKDHLMAMHELLSLNTNTTFNSNLDYAMKVLR